MGWKLDLASRWFSPFVLGELRAELRLFRNRLRCYFPQNLRRAAKLAKQTDIRLILGAGPHTVEGWVSLDLYPPPNGIRWDLRWRLPLADESVREIHCEHFLDQLCYPEEPLSFLRECKRVLQPGGQLRVVLTDAGKYARAYAGTDKKFWQKFTLLGGATKPFETEVEVFNQACRIRRYLYDVPTFMNLLHQAGFRKMEESKMGSHQSIDLKDWWRPFESFYIQVWNEGEEKLLQAKA